MPAALTGHLGHESSTEKKPTLAIAVVQFVPKNSQQGPGRDETAMGFTKEINSLYP